VHASGGLKGRSTDSTNVLEHYSRGYGMAVKAPVSRMARTLFCCSVDERFLGFTDALKELAVVSI
jgi:hypothetical protein